MVPAWAKDYFKKIRIKPEKLDQWTLTLNLEKNVIILHPADILTSSLNLSATKLGVLSGSTIVAGIPSILAAKAAARPALPPDAHTIFLQPCWDAFKIFKIIIITNFQQKKTCFSLLFSLTSLVLVYWHYWFHQKVI